MSVASDPIFKDFAQALVTRWRGLSGTVGHYLQMPPGARFVYDLVESHTDTRIIALAPSPGRLRPLASLAAGICRSALFEDDALRSELAGWIWGGITHKKDVQAVMNRIAEGAQKQPLVFIADVENSDLGSLRIWRTLARNGVGTHIAVGDRKASLATLGESASLDSIKEDAHGDQIVRLCSAHNVNQATARAMHAASIDLICAHALLVNKRFVDLDDIPGAVSTWAGSFSRGAQQLAAVISLIPDTMSILDFDDLLDRVGIERSPGLTELRGHHVLAERTGVAPTLASCAFEGTLADRKHKLKPTVYRHLLAQLHERIEAAPFMAATLGFLQAESGSPSRAMREFQNAASHAQANGFTTAAKRLRALAEQLSGKNTEPKLPRPSGIVAASGPPTTSTERDSSSSRRWKKNTNTVVGRTPTIDSPRRARYQTPRQRASAMSLSAMSFHQAIRARCRWQHRAIARQSVKRSARLGPPQRSEQRVEPSAIR